MPRALSSILLALVLVACASESIGPALAEYDFRYRIQPEGWPIQVFDDGKQTIFQFGEIEPILPEGIRLYTKSHFGNEVLFVPIK